MRSGAPIDTVISTVGGASSGGPRADYLGNRTLVDAYGDVCDAPGRFVLISSIGSGSSAVAVPPEIRARLADALDEKERAEEHLEASGLAYTIIRPGGLISAPATGRGVLTLDPRISGRIHRPDVAQLVCDSLVSERARNAVLSAVDTELVRDDLHVEVFPLV
jgi:uncharacterized protein YbjT (DUF2867 family)